MAQKREKEETELKVPESLPICTPPQPISTPPPHVPASRPTEGLDPKISSACDSRSSSGLTPESPDPVEKRVLKRQIANFISEKKLKIIQKARNNNQEFTM